ncbi:MAG: glycosyltransferase [Deltaproteobacteria bacterium]|nr:glycosyltransferase [Deltaproteobacteria bacterium]
MVARKVLFVIPGRREEETSMPFARRQVEALRRFAPHIETEIFFLQSRTDLVSLFSAALEFRSLVRKFKPELVHSQFGSMTGFFVLLLFRGPRVLTIRGSDLNPTPSMNQLRSRIGHVMTRFAALFSRATLCVSAELRERLWFAKRRSVILLEGVDSSVFNPVPQGRARARLGISHNDPILLFNAGRSPRVKRLDIAERVYEIVRQNIPAAKFHVLDGTVNPSEVPLWLNSADVLLVSSDFEGSPTIVKEAILCSLPLVSVDVGDVAQVSAGVTATHICDRVPGALATAVIAEMTKRERSNGFEIGVSRFGLERMCQKLTECYDGVVKRSPAGSSKA